MQLRGRRVVRAPPDHRDLARAVQRGLGDRQPPADEPWHPRAERLHHAQGPLGGRAVRLGAGVRRVAQQRASGGGPAGGGGVVRRVLRAPDQPLRVRRRVVQRARPRVQEAGQDVVDEQAGEVQPHALAGHRRQRQEALGDVGVVLQHARVGAHLPVLAGPGDTGLLVQVDPHQQVAGGHGGLHQVRPAEVRAGLGERGDRQAVPGGHHLVVPAGRGPPVARREQPLPDAVDPGRVEDLVPLRQLQHGRALLEGALLGHPEVAGGQFRVRVAEHLAQLLRRPHVVGALHMPPGAVVAVGVQRGGEAALRCAQFADHEVGRLQRHPARELRAGGPPQVGVDPAQQGVVVEHLLEVRDHPVAVHGVAGEAAAELVVDAAARHPLAGVRRHLQRALRAGAGVVPQQELDHHGRRELRRPAEPAALRVVLPGQPEQRLGQLLLAGHLVAAHGQLPARQVPRDLPGDLADLVAPLLPGLPDTLQHLPERRHAVPGGGREVGAEVERLRVRGEEHRHRPAALPGRRLHRLHVHGVDVRPLLAVDLDVDEVRVHLVGGGLVLEGLVGHDVAPVAAGVADAQQHRHVAPPRLREGLLGPGPPVDGVVGVLEEVGGRGLRKSVRHVPILAHSPRPARDGRARGPSCAPSV